MNITKEQFGEWRQHPATQFFLRYLADWRSDLERGQFNFWLDGGQLSDAIRGQINLVKDIEDLHFDAIQKFYEERYNAGEAIKVS